MIKNGTVTIFEIDDQKLFRDIMTAQGEAKEPLLRELIDKGFDNEAAIIAWLKRTHNYDMYAKIKGEALFNEAIASHAYETKTEEGTNTTGSN